jgi:ribosomal-protein-alanine N-acetyltransferase
MADHWTRLTRQMRAMISDSPFDAYHAALTHRPVLRTPRCLLRPPDAGDVPALVGILNDWDVASRLARIPYPYTADHAQFFVEQIAPIELAWAIVERASNQLIGMAGLAPYSPEPGTLELGYYLGRPHWGRGFATEAGAVIVAYGTGLVGQAQLRSGYFADNPASGRVLEKLGFVATGTALRDCLATGEVKASVELRL